ncbi:hypothetical protein DV737_g472, partial [Chaetothyriales sp. CBS 132003]
MNQNQLPYGQQLPMQPAQRRHDGSYAPMLPPHLRPHAAYPPYYAQQMAPILPQYPQHFPQNCPASTPSTAPIPTPPSPLLNTPTTVSARKEGPGHSESAGPPPAQITPSHAAAEPRPFVPPTPWLSSEGEAFPPRAPPQRRRIPRSRLANAPVEFPAPEPAPLPQAAGEIASNQAGAEQEQDTSRAEATLNQPQPPKSQQTPTQAKSKPVAPVIPVVPLVSPSTASTRRAHDSTSASQQLAPPTVTSAAGTATTKQEDESAQLPPEHERAQVPQEPVEAPTPAPALPPKPTSWANLGETLTEVLNDMNVPNDGPRRLCFLQPRGLVNTGNMCYMNSVLQVLVFCTPFYDFLAKIAQRAAHTFKSDTPLIDAIILLMQEYPVLQSAPSADQLCRSLKPDDYEKYGDPFVPEYVYSAISPLPRFRDMRRGHQQDAQEFLGLLLEELHDECSRAMRSATSTSSGRTTPVASAASAHGGHGDNDAGWMEVGHKQRPAVTRSSGTTAADSPVTNIFGGKLRSELKVAGNKLSVTLEPYSPLQLDIGSPEVGNIIDALKGLTKPESMQGDFHTSRGQRSTATKQVFIETLPPVLILHLKRFHYDHATKRAEKIWKKVGYPLDLEIPKEVFPVALRNRLAAHGGLPRYRLAAVIYHHGKNANGGHYTVDIRRQDGRQWIRMDDTLIRRVNGHSRAKSTAGAVANGAATPAKRSSGPHTPREKLSVKDSKVAYLLFYQRVSA